ncbi:MAG: JAB domain-containing protein [Proteobacteria bacterium]|nr:JAB domain-containing protein [Pseudomonadota bacterium]
MEHARGCRVRIIDNLEAARALFAPALASARDERLYIAHLDEAQRLIGLRIRFSTGAAKVELPVRCIVTDAVSLGSACLILAHNHPSGDPRPSATDIEATRSLARVARTIGIAIRDHLIFGGDLVVSFRQCGLL